MLARALLHTSLVLWMTGLTLQGGVRPQVSTLGRLGIPVKDASLGMGGAKPASYTGSLGALGARGYGGKAGKVAGRFPGAHLGGGYRGLGAGRAALKQGAGYGAYGVGLGAGMGMPMGAGLGNGMGLGYPQAGKRGVYGNGYGAQPGYGAVAGVGYAGVRPGLGAGYYPGQSPKGPKPGWPAGYSGGNGRAGGALGPPNKGGTFAARGAMAKPRPVAPLRTFSKQKPNVSPHSHLGATAHHPQGAGQGGALWTHTASPGEHLEHLDPVGRPSAQGATGTTAQAGTRLGLKDKATLVSHAGGAGPHQQHHQQQHHQQQQQQQLPFSIERNQGPGHQVLPRGQGPNSLGPAPHPQGAPQDPGQPHRAGGGPTALGASAGKQSKPPGGQVLVGPDGQSLRPATPLGQEDQNYGLSYANSHSSSGYYGMAYEQGQRNYDAAVADKQNLKARLAAGGGHLGLLGSGGPGASGPGAWDQGSRTPESRTLSVDVGAGRADQVANSFSQVEPVLTAGATRLAPPGPTEKRKQGPYMGYGAGLYPGAGLGATGYGAGLGQGGYPMAAGAGKLGGAANLGHGAFPQGGAGKPTEFGDGTGAYGAGGLGAGNGYGYGNGYNMGANGYGPGGAGSVPVGAGVYGDAQAMGLGSDSGLGIDTTGGKYGGGVGHLSNGNAQMIPAGLEGDAGYPYSAQQLALGAEAAAAKSASKFGVGAAYGAQQAGFAAQAAAGQDSYGAPHAKYGVNGYLGNGYKG